MQGVQRPQRKPLWPQLRYANRSAWICQCVQLFADSLLSFLFLDPAFITSMQFGKGRPKRDSYGNPLDPGYVCSPKKE